MSDELPSQQPSPEGRGISRGELQLVIRRAAELFTAEADADERLSEAEVLRIADELGLPGRHVRQALYELPRRPVEGGGWLDRWYGPAILVGTRVAPGPPDAVVDRLEDYLVTRELLQVLRRQGGKAVFAPADDPISSVTRAVRRPQRQWHIARSRRVLVEARPMPDQESHVRIELDVDPQRRKAVRSGIIGGAIVGLPLAAGAFFPGQMMFAVAGDAAAYAAGLTAGAGVLGASVVGGAAVARARFRARLDNARLEIAGLLDRLEGGRRLDPPAAPWLRSLRSRITDTLRPG